MEKQPEVTILMPAYNAAGFIQEAIDSVLRQSFTDFEFLIIDDGSTDSTAEQVTRYTDSRIHLITRPHHFINSLNEGLKLAKGTYIARMDADDIMHSERLRIQVKRMNEHPGITVCGSWMKGFGKNQFPTLLKAPPFKVENPLFLLLKGNIIFHPTALIRKEFLICQHIKYQNYEAAEDYKLWTDIAKAGGQFYNEPQALLFYRFSMNQVTVHRHREMISQAQRIREEIKEYLQQSGRQKV